MQFGACKDEQTAADTSGLSADKTSTGAATFLFIQAVEHLSKRHEALTCVRCCVFGSSLWLSFNADIEDGVACIKYVQAHKGSPQSCQHQQAVVV